MIFQSNVCRKRCSNITHNNRYKCLEDNSEIFTIDVNLCEIIGKPPTLVDVLTWLRTFNAFDVYMNIEADFYNSKKDKYASWNLNSIYLRDQSPELINFLINLNK